MEPDPVHQDGISHWAEWNRTLCIRMGSATVQNGTGPCASGWDQPLCRMGPVTMQDGSRLLRCDAPSGLSVAL